MRADLGGDASALLGLSMETVDQEVRSRISAALQEVVGRPVAVSDETDIVNDLGLDSLAVMNFVMALEDEYDISMPLDRMAEVQTVGDLVRTIEELRGNLRK
ncbi:MAG TPA: acyl carrier protein [Caulobacteraceae bacterium]|jgi:acyl carrier protein|nr:acyl carrier protein [Caulobacteraceae bacterium]